MEATDTLQAKGHPNVRSTHKTTLMLTTEEHLTTRGDCIIAIKATKGLKDLNQELKNLLREHSEVTMTIEINDKKLIITGKGHPELGLSHPEDMVIRKSMYICDRTLMIEADYAAIDVPKDIVRSLQDPNNNIKISIQALL